MESATLDRLMTRETVAGESPRCSASFFKLTTFRPERPAAVARPVRDASPIPLVLSLLDLFFLAVTQRSLAQRNGRGKLRSRGCLFPTLDIVGKNVFHTDR